MRKEGREEGREVSGGLYLRLEANKGGNPSGTKIPLHGPQKKRSRSSLYPLLKQNFGDFPRITEGVTPYQVAYPILVEVQHTTWLQHTGLALIGWIPFNFPGWSPGGCMVLMSMG